MTKKKDDQEPDLETLGEATDTPETPALPTYGQFMSLMDKLVTAVSASSMTPAAMKDILLETGKVNAELARKAKWPENTEHPHISAYFTEQDKEKYGDHTLKPKLTRDTFFCGAREDEDRLTCGEIEAYNAILTPRECRGGAWRAILKTPKAVGGKGTLEIWVPKDTVDQRMILPSLHLILHELNGGPSTEDIYSLVKQIEALKTLLAKKGATAGELEAALLGQ